MELHRHMGGSIRAETVWEIIKRTKENIAPSLESVRKKMIVSGVDDRNFDTFFGKFRILDKLTWYDWAIDLAIQQICEDLEKESIEYAEISLSINKYMIHLGWTPKKVVQFICESYSRHSRRFGVKVGLLLSLKYESNRESQLNFANLIDDPDIRPLLSGIDLVGDENYYDVEFYKPIFDKWKSYDKILRCHVGELNGGRNNIISAIKDLQVNRIAHGVHATEEDVKIANEYGVYFDVAIHSNIYTGVVDDIKNHPLKNMVKWGAKITLNTDDPVQCDCTIDSEFSAAVKSKLITTDDIDRIQRNAVEAVGIMP